ncbi:hypothetical protein CI102_3335 [Trichoderma harzianum]|nr:hypothetical protein CI102_3335 [Trichoderma harzianum]
MKPSRSTTLEKIPILPSLGLVTLPKSLTHLCCEDQEGKGKKIASLWPVDIPLGNAHRRPGIIHLQWFSGKGIARLPSGGNSLDASPLLVFFFLFGSEDGSFTTRPMTARRPQISPS